MKPIVSTARNTIIDQKPNAPRSAKRHRPRKQESDFQVENDEQNRYEVVADIEADPGIVERLEAAFVGRQLLPRSGAAGRPRTRPRPSPAEMPPAIARNTRIGK